MDVNRSNYYHHLSKHPLLSWSIEFINHKYRAYLQHFNFTQLTSITCFNRIKYRYMQSAMRTVEK